MQLTCVLVCEVQVADDLPGLPVIFGPQVVTDPLSLTLDAGAAEGTVIGTLSVLNGCQDYAISLVDDAGGQVKLVGDVLQAGADASSFGQITVRVLAAGPCGSSLSRTIAISVNDASFVPSFDFSDERNSQNLIFM